MAKDQEPVGSLGEEAAKLFAALTDAAHEHGAAASGMAGEASRVWHEVDDHLAHGAQCRYCPLCRAIAFARMTSPEVREHLATAATSLAQAVAGILATEVPEEETTARSSADRRKSETEHIDLDDDPRDGE